MKGREFQAKNSTFSADAKKATFSTDISGAYPEEAAVDKWVRSYTLDRGKKFTINDNYQLERSEGCTTIVKFCNQLQSF